MEPKARHYPPTPTTKALRSSRDEAVERGETLEEGAARGVPAEVAEGEERPEALRDGLVRVQQPLAEEPLHLRGGLERGGDRHLTPAIPCDSRGEAVTGGGGGGGGGGSSCKKIPRRQEKQEDEEELRGVDAGRPIEAPHVTSPLEMLPPMLMADRDLSVPAPVTGSGSPCL